MTKLRLVFFIVLFFVASPLSAVEIASKLKGQIVANSPVGLQVLMKNSEGVILDLTDTTAGGVYILDLSIMDLANRENVSKLFIEVKDKKGKAIKVAVAEYLNIFDKMVLLKPIVFD